MGIVPRRHQVLRSHHVVLHDQLPQRAAVGQQFAGRVGMFLRVDHFDATYQRMLDNGVTFVSPPRQESYGRIAVFVDIAGNRWDLLGSAN